MKGDLLSWQIKYFLVEILKRQNLLKSFLNLSVRWRRECTNEFWSGRRSILSFRIFNSFSDNKEIIENAENEISLDFKGTFVIVIQGQYYKTDYFPFTLDFLGKVGLYFALDMFALVYLQSKKPLTLLGKPLRYSHLTSWTPSITWTWKLPAKVKKLYSGDTWCRLRWEPTIIGAKQSQYDLKEEIINTIILLRSK